ncbi:unnamed protein product [Cercospora beticola]|nr:unnamed protein product [Cercospora beticola]
MSLLARVDTQTKHKTLEDYFDDEFKPDAPGSCHRWENKVPEAWEETVQMLRVATGKATMLKSSMPAPAMAERWEEWIRAEQTFRALLALHAQQQWEVANFYRFGKPHSKLKNQPGTPLGDRTMAEIIEGRCPTGNRLPRKPYLRCDSDYFLYVRGDHIDPRDTGTSAEDKHTIARPSESHIPCPNGAWILQGFAKKDSFYSCQVHSVEPGEKLVRRDVCMNDPKLGKNLAQSIWFEYTIPSDPWNWNSKRRIVTWCPEALNRESWSAAAGAHSIKEGDRLGHSMALTWVHEMYHYVQRWLDGPALKSDGSLWAGKQTYGWNKAVNLGQHRPERAIVSPENMDLFAAAMYFKEWHWGSGLAKKCPEEDDFDPIKVYPPDPIPPEVTNDSDQSSESDTGSSDSHHSGDESNTLQPNSPARRNAVPQHKRRNQEPQDDGNSDSTIDAEQASRETSANDDDATAEVSKEGLPLKREDEYASRELENFFRSAWADILDILSIAKQKAELLAATKSSNPEEIREQLRLKQIFRALFGDSSPTLLAENYQYLLVYGIESQIYLQCGDNALVYLKATSVDPRDAGTPNEGKYTLAKSLSPIEPCPHGAWFFAGLEKAKSFYECQHTPLPGRYTFRHAGWCPGRQTYGQVVETPTKTVLGFCNSILSSDTWSVKEESTNIKEGQDFHFDKYLQSTWIHEMFHYIEKFIDEPSVDDTGKPQGEAPYDSSMRKTFGWPSCVDLGQHEPERALKSPENLAAFAMAAYLEQWHWASGVAKKAPEKEPFDPIQAYKTNMHDQSSRIIS